jgi:hypothetical protein
MRSKLVRSCLMAGIVSGLATIGGCTADRGAQVTKGATADTPLYAVVLNGPPGAPPPPPKEAISLRQVPGMLGWTDTMITIVDDTTGALGIGAIRRTLGNGSIHHTITVDVMVITGSKGAGGETALNYASMHSSVAR